jgi:hypothetical protein
MIQGMHELAVEVSCLAVIGNVKAR